MYMFRIVLIIFHVCDKAVKGQNLWLIQLNKRQIEWWIDSATYDYLPLLTGLRLTGRDLVI